MRPAPAFVLVVAACTAARVVAGDAKEGTKALRPSLPLPLKNVDGSTGAAMLDHPANFRHPTLWRARDHGLVAANPFGLHDFTGAARGAGGPLTLRHRIVFHEGDAEAAGIAAAWRHRAAAPEAVP